MVSEIPLMLCCKSENETDDELNLRNAANAKHKQQQCKDLNDLISMAAGSVLNQKGLQ